MYICSKCNFEFKSESFFLVCPKCHAFLLKCYKCNEIFERNSKYQKLNICSNCLKKLPDKEELKRLLFIKKLSRKEVTKRLKIPGILLNRLIGDNLETIECLLCREQGIEFKRKKLNKHLLSKHRITSNEYLQKFNVPAFTKDFSERQSSIIKNDWEKGLYNGLCYVTEINDNEKLITSFSNQICYVGANKLGINRFFLRTITKLRNPDFIIIDDQQYLEKLKDKSYEEKQNIIYNDFISKNIEIKKVIEYCGYGWHYQRFNGLTKEEYEEKIKSDYKSLKIECLIIWDYELESDKDFVKSKILSFINGLKFIDKVQEKIKKVEKCIFCNKNLAIDNDYLCQECKERESKLFSTGKENIDYVSCKICGVKRESLVSHIPRKHQISNFQYRRFFKSSTICFKVSKQSSLKISETVKKLWNNGHYKKNPGFLNINKTEEFILSFSDNLIYTGGNKKSYNRFFIDIEPKKRRSPDFVIITDEKYLTKLIGKTWFEKEDIIARDFNLKLINITKVLEFCSSIWHSNKFNGRTKKQYEQNIKNDYLQKNIDCLIVWNTELKNINELKIKINNFILK